VGALVRLIRQGADTRGDLEPIDVDLLLALLGGKLSRADKSARNKAAWSTGDRRKWGGERRQRDPRRGWRNHKGSGTC
jgi:hypothetical protein